MPRNPQRAFSINPFHITARGVNKEPFKIPLEEVWDIMQDYLFFISKAYEIQIHAFVLMRNHWHLIASSANGHLSSAMNYLMRDSSRAILHEAHRINQTYGGRHFKSELATTSYYLNAYKYLYRNPVAAGLVDKCEDYQFSSLSGLLGARKMHIPIVEDTTLFSNYDLQKLLGHARFEETQRYAHLTPEHLAKAINIVSFGGPNLPAPAKPAPAAVAEVQKSAEQVAKAPVLRIVSNT